MKISNISRSDKGVAQLLIVILLFAGIVLGVYLAGQTQIFKPKASISEPTGPQTALFLQTIGDAKLLVSGTVSIGVYARSDVTEANLFVAKIKFPSDYVSIESIDKKDSFISQWLEEYFDNSSGDLSLIGAVPNPGYKTNFGEVPVKIATVNFKLLKTGNVTINLTQDSAIYRNLDNTNILAVRGSADINIYDPNQAPSEPPVVIATPSPKPPSLLTLTIPLFKGWNLVGLGLIPTKPILASNLASTLQSQTSSDIIIIGFDYEEGQAKAYFTSPDKKILNSLQALYPQGGYWVRVDNPAEISVTGNPPIFPYDATYTSGWQMISFPYFKGKKASEFAAFLKTFTGSDVILQGFSAEEGQAKAYFTAVDKQILNTLNIIEPTKGYWLKIDKSITVRISSDGSMEKIK